MVQLATGSEMEGGGEGEQETSRAQGSDRTARVLVVPSAARSMVVYGVHTQNYRTILQSRSLLWARSTE